MLLGWSQAHKYTYPRMSKPDAVLIVGKKATVVTCPKMLLMLVSGSRTYNDDAVGYS